MSISFFKEFILRTPIYPIKTLDELYRKRNWEEVCEFSLDFFQNNFNESALYLASQDLHESFLKLKQGTLPAAKKQKVVLSLAKYMVRMCTRATPFGLFSAVTVGNFGREDEIVLKRETTAYLRPDFSVVSQLIEGLSANRSLWKYYQYSFNGSFYEKNHKAAYIEYDYTEKTRKYQLNYVDAFPILDIARSLDGGLFSYEQLFDVVSKYPLDNIGAEDLIFMLIENKIIIPQLYLNAFVEKPLNHLLSFLESVPDHILLNLRTGEKTIGAIKVLLRQMVEYTGVRKGWGIPFYDLPNLHSSQLVRANGHHIQLDLYREAAKCSVNEALKEQIVEVYEFLNQIGQVERIEDNMDKLVNAFYKKYENQEISLLEATDPEIGILYANKDDENNPLSGIQLLTKNSSSGHHSVSSTDLIMYSKLIDCAKSQSYEIELTDTDFPSTKKSINPSENLPRTFNIVLQPLSEQNTRKYFLKPVMSNTATRYLSRFCYLDKRIEALAAEITQIEQDDENVLIAEINHLPEDKAGNVILRPLLRTHQISCFTDYSSNSIQLNDLFISVRNGNFVLRSRTLNKYIHPIFSTAYNVTLSQLPVFNFLSRLAKQSVIGFEWGTIANKTTAFLPRVSFKNFVLSPASWRFKYDDYKELLKQYRDDCVFRDKFIEWRQKHRLPEQCKIVQQESYIFIDFRNFISIQLFMAELSLKKDIKIEESFDCTESFVKDENIDSHFGELIFHLYTQTRKNQNVSTEVFSNMVQPKRNFMIGNSSWIYFKIYGSESFLDGVLLKELKWLTSDLKQNGIINEWFYVRYKDPDPHIRIRLLLNSKELFVQVVEKTNRIFSELINCNLIDKIQFDVYKREIERYGTKNISRTERLFFYDSCHVINCLSKLTNLEDRWQIALSMANEYFNAFSLSFLERLDFLESILDNFSSEFSLDVAFNRQVSDLYRKYKRSIEEIINDQRAELQFDQDFKNFLVEEVQITKTELKRYLSDYLHMTMNRIFQSNQRKFEVIIYSLLKTAYKSATKRIEIQNPGS